MGPRLRHYTLLCGAEDISGKDLKGIYYPGPRRDGPQEFPAPMPVCLSLILLCVCLVHHFLLI